MLRIVLATANPHKVHELRAIFAHEFLKDIELVGLDACGFATREPDETGTTFEQNATIKAIEYARQTGMICLADDSGLEVDALGGRPGVISSHYCSDGREEGMSRELRDASNNARVLRELASVPFDQRAARFVCVMALAVPRREVCVLRGTCEGRIGLPPRVPAGAHGFGYDPLFLVAPEFSRTSAELAPQEKHAVSHRGAAARAMAQHIRQEILALRLG
jgi:XTP/dITP diphosphohydrolase